MHPSTLLRTAFRSALMSLSTAVTLVAQDAANVRPEKAGTFSAEVWCKDTGTYCWTSPKARNWLNGVRFVGDVDVGYLQQGGANRFEQKAFKGLTKFGVESNLWRGLAALQVVVIPPGKVTYEAESPLRRDGVILDPGGELKVDYGYSVGLSLFDGVMSVGVGRLFYDPRGFQNPDPAAKRDGFWHINWQPIASIRKLIKSKKDPSEETS
jgi:hypothetical protein